MSARRIARRPTRSTGDDGFTLVELLVTLVVVAMIIPLAFGLIRNLVQQSQDVHDTMVGVQQDQIAGEALLQYLHGATVILPGSDATTLNASILAGTSSTYTPYTATLSATLADSATPGVDATFSTSLTPDGGQTTSIGTYDAVNSSAVFTYYYNASTSTSTSTSTSSTTTTTAPSTTTSLPGNLATTTTPTDAQLSEIVAVGIDVTFLAGPHVPTEGFQAVRPSNFQTTIYLQNASGAPAPVSTTSVAAPSSPVVNSPMTVSATVSPVPDGGNITFTVTEGGVSEPYCTSPVDVDTTTGTASCTFTVATSGSYSVSAAYSGTGQFQPSSSSAVSFSVPLASSLSVAAVPGRSSSGTVTFDATVSPSSATGSVSFTLQSSHGCWSGCTFSGSQTVSGGSASWTATGLQSGTTYSYVATYTDPTGAYGSSTTSGSVAAP